MLGTVVLTFFGTIVFMLSLRPLAFRLGLVDAPGGRKNHVGVVPLIGGLAIYAGFALGLSVNVDALLAHVYLLIAGALLVFTGSLDDKYELSANLRLLIQVTVVLLIILGAGAQVTSLGSLFGIENVGLGRLSLIFTVGLCLASINSYNMIDGMDGLAAGLSAIAMAGFLIMALLAGSTQIVGISSLLAACLAFMLFNFPSAINLRVRSFLGDAGSTFLGLAVAWYCIRLSQGEMRVLNPVTTLWFVAIPLFDIIASMIRRIGKGQSPLHPDRGHFHHILQRAGFSVGEVLLIMLGLSAGCAAIGILGELAGVSETFMLVIYGAVGYGYYSILDNAWRMARFLGRRGRRRRRRGRGTRGGEAS